MRQPVLATTALVFLIAPSAARSADVDDLRAAHEEVVMALNARDVDRYVAARHHRAVQFRRNAEFATDYEQVGKTAAHQGLQNYFAATERLTVKWLDPQYRVIGNTGIVWGHIRGVRKPKDRPQETWTARATMTYAKLERKWVRVCSHISAIPSGN